MTPKPIAKSLVVFTLAYMAVSIWVALRSGNKEFIFYIVVMFVLMAIVWAVHQRVDFSRRVLWCLTAWGFSHMAGGLVPLPEGWPYNGENAVLYSLWLIPGYLKYDQVVHAFGFGVTAWVCWEALRAAMQAQTKHAIRPTPGLAVLCAFGGMGFGALNEVIEFIATISLPYTNVGGYLNTGWDLVANVVGCTIAGALILLFGDKGDEG